MGEGEKEVCDLFADDFQTLQVTGKKIRAEKYSHKKKEDIAITRTTRGYPISFFGVHRRCQATTDEAPPPKSSSSHSYPPPFFPVPDYSEGVRDDSGCSFAIGEHLSSDDYFRVRAVKSEPETKEEK